MRYNYLSNKDFLKIIDNLPNKTQYVKITVLSMAEDPIAAIEGYATSGSVSINGSSAVRRTGSVAMIADDSFYNILEVENLISINKRIMLEVGIENTTPYYRNENIIWFPLGVFVIGNASISRNNQGLNISLNLKDKMALLSGDVSGTLPTAMVHSPLTVEDDMGAYSKEYVKFKDIIMTLVHEWGGIPKSKIIIEDIPDRIDNTVRWTADYKVYLEEYGTMNGTPVHGLTPYNPENKADSFGYQDNIGYQRVDFTYPTEQELSSNAGDSITSVLDKIKNSLGNFEYFFDLDGNFHFQEIKNYINEGSPETNLEAAIAGAGRDYLINTNEKSVYDFSDGTLISAYNNNPQFNMIKNDINVWGIRGDSKAPIYYHLIIDNKPALSEHTYPPVVIYQDAVGITRARLPKNATEETTTIIPTDWRTEMYLAYVCGIDTSNPYGKELKEYWPTIYDIKNGKFYAAPGNGDDDVEVKKRLNSMAYFFDIINPTYTAEDGKTVEYFKDIKVSAIGRRRKVLNDNNINCLFSPTFPDYFYIPTGTENTKTLRAEAIQEGKQMLQVIPSLAKNIAVGSAFNAAYDAIRAQIHEMTGYNENISITTLPIYHLEPNTRITVNDEKSSIHGDYMIKSFSLPLAYNGTMTLQCTKAIERI